MSGSSSPTTTRSSARARRRSSRRRRRRRAGLVGDGRRPPAALVGPRRRRHGPADARRAASRRPRAIVRLPRRAVLVLTMSETTTRCSPRCAPAPAATCSRRHDRADRSALQAVARGEAVFGARIADRVLTWFTAARTAASSALPFPQLTDREREVLDLVARGLPNAAIAPRLFLSGQDRPQQRLGLPVEAAGGVAAPRPSPWRGTRASAAELGRPCRGRGDLRGPVSVQDRHFPTRVGGWPARSPLLIFGGRARSVVGIGLRPGGRQCPRLVAGTLPRPGRRTPARAGGTPGRPLSSLVTDDTGPGALPMTTSTTVPTQPTTTTPSEARRALSGLWPLAAAGAGVTSASSRCSPRAS